VLFTPVVNNCCKTVHAVLTLELCLMLVDVHSHCQMLYSAPCVAGWSLNTCHVISLHPLGSNIYGCTEGKEYNGDS
jgi:hypothetical protein